MPREYRLAVVGGTFDHFHRGHEALLRTAFENAQVVGIGITSEEYLRRHRKPFPARVQSFLTRRRTLERWLTREYPGRRWWTTPVSDRLGGAVDPRVDLLVATRETSAGAHAVNKTRRGRGLRPLEILNVPLVAADDFLPISSRRIRSGAIDATGRRLTPVRVGILGASSRDRRRITQSMKERFGRIPLRMIFHRSEKAPSSSNRLRPPRRAIVLALVAQGTNDYGLGIARGRKRLTAGARAGPIVAVTLAGAGRVAIESSVSAPEAFDWERMLRNLTARFRSPDLPKDSSLRRR